MAGIYNGFLAAIQEKLGNNEDLFPLVPEVFAKIIVEARKQDDFAELNEFLRHVKVYGTPLGLKCPEFEEFMTSAQSTGTLDRLNPTYFRAKVSMTPERLEKVQKEFGENWQGVERLADMYLERVGHAL